MSDNQEPVPAGWDHIDPPLSLDELLARKKALDQRKKDSEYMATLKEHVR